MISIFLSELLDFCFAEGRLNSAAAVIFSGDPAELKFFSWPTTGFVEVRVSETWYCSSDIRK
jgi:hypothetical protein